MALVTGQDLPGPTDLDVEDAAYLGGMSDAIGEGRRRLLDLLRGGEVEQAERLLAAMEEMYGVLVTMDYPDAITMNLRRVTDVSRSLIEKTRGDLSISVVQKDLRDALDRHAAELRGDVRLRRLKSLCYAARRPGGVAQTGRALPSHGRGQGFKSPHLHPCLADRIGDAMSPDGRSTLRRTLKEIGHPSGLRRQANAQVVELGVPAVKNRHVRSR